MPDALTMFGDQRRPWHVVSLVAVLLSGCAVMAPETQRPAAPIPAAWPAIVKTGTADQTTMPKDWATFFPDPRLQAMMADALEHNRDLRSAVARVEEARAMYGIQRADRLPNLQIGAARTVTQTPAALSSTGVETTTRRVDVNVGLLAFELDFWGRVASLSEAAKASYLATEEAQHAFRLSLMADVADAYWALQEANERAALARASWSTRSETLRMVQTRRDVGLAGDLEVLQAQGAVEAARAEMAALERQAGLADNTLRVLVGRERPDWPAGQPLTSQAGNAELAVGLPADVLLKRPDVLAAEHRLRASNAMIGAARAAFFPRIALTGSYGSASPELSGLFDANTTAWTFTPSLSLPLFSGGRLVSNLDLAAARKEIAIADYERTVQQAFREVADGLVARQTLREQSAALHAFEQTQTQRLAIAQARFEQGVASFLEVLDAQRELFNAQQNLIAIRRAFHSASARLYKALGGGTS